MYEVVKYQPSQAELRRKSYSQVPGLIDSLSNTDKQIYKESLERPIRAIPDAELLQTVNIILPRIAKDMGYSFKDTGELQNLITRSAEILKNYYSGLSIKGIVLAFELCLIGELDRYLPKRIGGEADRSHYNNFGLEYICKILNAYKNRRGEMLDSLEGKAPAQKQERKPQEDAMYERATKIDCILCFWYYKYHNKLPDISPIAEMLYYNLLSRVGLTPEVEVTIAEQQAIWQRTVNEFARQGQVSDVAKMRVIGIEGVQKEHRTYALARRRALEAAFAQMIKDEIQITDYIRP